MATGYENYVSLMWTNPAAALSQAQLHLQKLMEQQGPRVGSDGAMYDPAALEAAIALTERHIQSLAARVHGIGRPRLIPTRRVDPGVVNTPYGN
jgi:hypothetical protein